MRDITQLTAADIGKTIRVEAKYPSDNVTGVVGHAEEAYYVDGVEMVFALAYNEDLGEFLDGDRYEVVAP